MDADDRTHLVSSSRHFGVAQLTGPPSFTNPVSREALFSISGGHVDITAEADDKGETKPGQIGEKLRVAKSTIGENRDLDAFGTVRNFVCGPGIMGEKEISHGSTERPLDT